MKISCKQIKYDCVNLEKKNNYERYVMYVLNLYNI